MNAANIITLARLLSVPVTIWLILSSQWQLAFILFVLAGVSDAIDGFLAKRFDMRTRLGGFLDPLADKTLLVSIYIALGAQGQVPIWLVILVVSRDVLIVGGVLLSFAMNLELAINPLLISKANTVAQIGLAALVLADRGVMEVPESLLQIMVYLVSATTVLSGASYLVSWARGQGLPGAST